MNKKLLTVFAFLIAIIVGAGWWYLNSSQSVTESSTLQEKGSEEVHAAQGQNSDTETNPQSGSSLPNSLPKEQTAQMNPESPSAAESAPTCVITANKSIYQREEPMTFSWKIQNAQMANFLINTETDQDEYLTNVLFPNEKNLTKITRAIRSSGKVTAALQLYSDNGEEGTCVVNVVVM